MKYFNRISDLIHDKQDYESAIYYIRELLSGKSLNAEEKDLLELKLRYCTLKLGKLIEAPLEILNLSSLQLEQLFEVNLEKFGESGFSLNTLKISPKVTVILPIYNAPIALGKCLDSLLSLTPNDIRIIAINDARLTTKSQKYLIFIQRRET